MAGVLVTVGQLEDAGRHFDAAIAAYDPERPQPSALGSDLGVFAHAWSSHARWLLGDEEGAVEAVDTAVALAQRLQHPYSETLALAYAGLLHQMRGDAERVRACAREVIGLSDRYGFGYYGDWARLLTGWADGEQRPAEAVAAIEASLARLDQQRAQARRPYYLSLLAETLARAGDEVRARTVLDGAIALALERVDLWWLPALYLQQSTLLSAADREQALGRALDLARAQRSRSLERRIVSGVGSGEVGSGWPLAR
jgi:predicted ATPase